MYLSLCPPESVPTMFRMSKILKKAEHLWSLAKHKMFGGFLEALANQGWSRAWSSQERLAELNLTEEMDKGCVDFNNNKVCNLYNTLTGQITF